MNLEDVCFGDAVSIDEFHMNDNNFSQMPLFPLIPKIFFQKMSKKRFAVDISIYKFLAKIGEI